MCYLVFLSMLKINKGKILPMSIFSCKFSSRLCTQSLTLELKKSRYFFQIWRHRSMLYSKNLFFHIFDSCGSAKSTRDHSNFVPYENHFETRLKRQRKKRSQEWNASIIAFPVSFDLPIGRWLLVLNLLIRRNIINCESTNWIFMIFKTWKLKKKNYRKMPFKK